jgi:hypothetical protein
MRLLAKLNVRQELNFYHQLNVFGAEIFYTNFLDSNSNSMLPGSHQTQVTTLK